MIGKMSFRRSFYALVYFYALFHKKKASFVYRTKDAFLNDVFRFRGT